jgi:hypothetical protein
MANPEHLKILKQGVEVWNRWRRDNPLVEPDLSQLVFIRENLTELDGINLERALLSQASVLNASLKGAKMRAAMLSCARFAASDFTDADMSSTQLTLTKFHSTIMIRTNFEGASFHQTFMHEVDLANASLKNAKLFINEFIATRLTDAKDLHLVEHTGSSVIDVSTLVLSCGIPKSFLIGCGLPESLFNWYLDYHLQSPKFYKCFISYSDKDTEFTERLYADLKNKGVHAWRWKEDAKMGSTLMRSIDEAIKEYDKMVLICSKDSLVSPAVHREIERALQKEDANSLAGRDPEVLIPIRIDDYIIDSCKHHRGADIRRKKIGDFTKWRDHDEYQKAFDDLLRGMQTIE